MKTPATVADAERELPALPPHPESHTYRWTKLEQIAIRQYGADCARAAAPVGADVAQSRAEQVLRRLLAYRAAGSLLYADDGELQDNAAHPYIDFKRDSVDEIERKLGDRASSRLAAGAPAETVRLISSEADLSDAKIIEVLHSCGVDTYQSKHGFSATQVSATSIPTLRAVLEILAGAKPATWPRGTIVRKKFGSEWEGAIVGEYRTALTPEGYAVESSTHRGSVQIYPVSALELVAKGNV